MTSPVFRKKGGSGTHSLLSIAAMTLLALAVISVNSLRTVRAETVAATIQAGQGITYLDVNPSTNTLYVSNTYANNSEVGEGDTVTVIDAATHAVIATITVGSYPRGVAANPTTDRVYVANQIGNTVTVIEGSTNTVIDTIKNVTNPWGLALNARTNKIYVVNNPASLTVIDGSTDKVTARVPLPTKQWSQDVAVNSVTNMVYVTSATYSCIPRCGPLGLVSVINGTTNTLTTTIGVGESAGDVAVNPTANMIYATNGGYVSAIDGGTNRVVGMISGGGGGVAVNPATNKLYTDTANTLWIINATTGATMATLTVGPGSYYAAVDSYTNSVYVINNGDGTVSVVDGDTET